MKLYTIVLEKLPGEEKYFARTHYEEIVLKPGYEEVSRQVFASRKKAHDYLYALRQKYGMPSNVGKHPTQAKYLAAKKVVQ